MKKQGYPNENTFIFKDSSSFFSCMRDSVFIQHVFGALPFSPGRLLIRSVDTLRDSWPGLDLIPHLKRDTLYRTDTNYSLQQLMHFLIPLTDSTSIDTANADFIVVVPWAAFLGRYNDRLFSVREAIRQNRKVVIKPLFLCIDVQQTWEIARNKNKVFEFE
ncbi:MAG: hypothetical protein JXA23_06355 [Bacteroidales bacterium]|nr:hypothetical protein [Bacteroidales bacterium]